MQNYSKYLFQELLFLVNLIWYLVIHPKHFRKVIKYSRRIPGITLHYKIPWLTFLAIDWLHANLDKDMRVFEWGSGGSTLLFTKRAGSIISIEHDEAWHRDMVGILSRDNISNCDYSLVKKNGVGVEAVNDDVIFENYYKAIAKYPDNSFDVVVIDGKARNDCALQTPSKVKPGGIVIFDNSERESYKSGMEVFNGWERLDFYGPGPYNHYFWRTTIFIKPNKR